MKKLYKIGEFSKLCRVTVKTLRHYEDLGLLYPVKVDESSGYRYYEISQAITLNTIVHLKDLGLTLFEIKDIFDKGNDRPEIDLIQSKIQDCKKQITLLSERLTELQSLEKSSAKKIEMKEFEIKTLESRIVASHRQIIKTYDELGPICYGVIGPEMMRLGCKCPEPQYCYTIEHDPEHKDVDIDVEYCEAVDEIKSETAILKFYKTDEVKKALCFKHIGPYTKFSDSMTKVLDYINEKGYNIIGQIRFSYIDGAWNKQTQEEYVTEIQVPIE